uniref:Uncharacterized protein n=1 Tax=Lactuca sativa TaxID=4236 RepID=A0A9R1XBH8_LACSA|nr:hypothetical protein LSAT_V11C500273440 [Lactuca sativa]
MVCSTSTNENEKEEECVDFKGNPADMSNTGGWVAAGLILGTELSERICVIGISMNLVTYLHGSLHLSSSKSANIVSNFMGTLNLLALFGGFIADAKIGRFLAILIFSFICALGMVLLTLATTIQRLKPPSCETSGGWKCIEATGSQLAMLYIALYTVALGGGGIKSNVSGFGSDQFDKSTPEDEKKMVYFFNRFYFCISVGSLFAVTVMVYLQDKKGWGVGYGVSAGTMGIAVFLLLCGTRFYRYKKPKGSPLSVIWRVVFLAMKNRRLPYPNHPSLLNGYDSSKVQHTEKLRCLDKAAIMATNEANEDLWIVSSVTEVEEVKMVINLIPIWSTGILFWTIYSQMNTFTVEQANIMNRKHGRFNIPPGSFSFFLFISILLFTSLNERLIVPFAKRITNYPKGLTSLQRIGIGLVFSVAGMVAAAICEIRRKSDMKNGVKTNAFWLVPQFFLVGAGEAFAYVGQLEFFITEAPEKMKSMSTGLFQTTLAMGFFVSSLLVSLTNMATHERWLKNNLDQGELNNFYWMLAILGVFNFFGFLILASRHQYKSQHYENEIETRRIDDI